MQAKKWQEAFEVYDRIKKGWSFEDLSIKKRKKAKTVHKQYKRAYESIYPGDVFREREDKPRVFREYQRPTIATKNDRHGEIEQHNMGRDDHWILGDCIHCRKTFCVNYLPNIKAQGCLECGKEQKTGKTYRELMKI